MQLVHNGLGATTEGHSDRICTIPVILFITDMNMVIKAVEKRHQAKNKHRHLGVHR